MKATLRAFLLIPLFLFVGCQSTNGTHIYSPKTGKKLADFTADMGMSEFRGGGVYWKVTGHYPSKTITARGNAATKLVRGTGSAVGTGARAFITP